MRPEPPPRFHAGRLESLLVRRLGSVPTRMIARSLVRRPVRAALTVIGLAMAFSILVVGRYFMDAVQELAQVQFRLVQREDVTVAFHHPRPARARYEVAVLPGVLRSEPFRVVAARLRHGHRTRRVPLFGLDPGSELRLLLDEDLARQAVPREGVLLTRQLAELLHVAPGGELVVEVLEGERPVRTVRVAGTVDERIGLNAYMDRRAVNRLMREGGTVSGAFLRVDARHEQALHAELKRMPAVAGTGTRRASLASFEKTLGQSLGIFNLVLVAFSSTIACAMVYNTARIALSERGREFASLRVLGFTRAEVARMMFGEQALLLALAAPLGCAIGTAMAASIARAYQWELFRLPLTVGTRTYAFALLVVAAAAAASGWIVRRRLDRIDLVEVLKARE